MDNIYIQNEANADFNRMMNNRRGKPSVFKNQVGYMCLKEHTEKKGVHFHTLFTFDGNKVQKDVHMGEELVRAGIKQQKRKVAIIIVTAIPINIKV